MTDATLASGRRTATGPVLATYRWLMRTQLIIAAWALLMIAVVAAIAILIVDRVGTVQNSIVGFSRQGVIWLPFSLAIIWAVSYVNVHVAMGLTRRALGRATILAALSTSAVYAVGCVALIQVERAVYSATGWRHVIVEGLALVSDTSQVGLLLGEYFIAAAAGLLGGLLCGIVFYRAGGWWGTLAIPLTVGPVVLIQSGMSADLAWLGGDLAVGTAGGGLVRTAVAVAVLLAVAVAYRAVLRTTPVLPAPLV